MGTMAIDSLHQKRTLLRWSRIDPDGPGLHLPKKQNDIGWDLEAAESKVILPGVQVDVPTNIRLELPDNIWAEVRARSSIAKRQLQIEAGTIDPGYRGPIFALLRNIAPSDHGALASIDPIHIEKGERVAQLVFHRVCPVWTEEVDEIDMRSERAESGFGSTGL